MIAPDWVFPASTVVAAGLAGTLKMASVVDVPTWAENSAFFMLVFFLCVACVTLWRSNKSLQATNELKDKVHLEAMARLEDEIKSEIRERMKQEVEERRAQTEAVKQMTALLERQSQNNQ